MAITKVTRHNTPAFEAYLAAAQSVTEATDTKLTFTAETFDSDGKFASSRFTPTISGKYFFYSKAGTDPSSYENERSGLMKLYKNGADVAHYKSDHMTGGNTSTDGSTATTHNIYGTIDLDTDDYLEIYFNFNTWSDSGATVLNKVFGAYRIGA